MQFGRFVGRIKAKNHADENRETESQDDHIRRHGKAHVGKRASQTQNQPGYQQSDQAAKNADHQGLDQELQQDPFTAGADRFTNADFPGPLSHGNQHDVHDADSADQQRYAGNAAKQQTERAQNRIHGVEDRRLVEDRKGILILPKKAQQGICQVRLSRIDCLAALGCSIKCLDVLLLEHALRQTEGNDDLLIVPAKSRGPLLENTDNQQFAPVDRDAFAEDPLCAKQFVGDIDTDDRDSRLVVIVGRFEEPPGRKGQAADRVIGGRRALNGRVKCLRTISGCHRLG